jgi:hypothetical protein
MYNEDDEDAVSNGKEEKCFKKVMVCCLIH